MTGLVTDGLRTAPDCALRIGITIGLARADESLWINGIKQNALFLAKCFRHSPLGHRVTLLNMTDVPVDTVAWDRGQFPTLSFAEGWQGLDVVIELGAQIGLEHSARLKAQGTRIVSYCCGAEYAMNIEAMIFRRRLWDRLYVNPHYDEIWVPPQVAETSLHFFKTLRRKPARVVPFVWDPVAMEAMLAGREDGGLYRPHEGGRRLSVIEPNIDVLKFCLYPMLIAEQAFRRIPDDIAYLHVANAEAMALEGNEFTQLALELDIVKANKASFIGRVDTPHFLADHTDILISHQWGLPLNYIYLEACWQGYPLVYNAELISDLGYFYPDSDAARGSEQLIAAVRDHDRDWQGYRDRQRQAISRFLATDPRVIAAYDALLAGLMNGPDQAASTSFRSNEAAAAIPDIPKRGNQP